MLFFTLLLLAAGNIVISALTDFTDFPRLRFPVDWAMTLVFAVSLVEVVRALAGAAAVLRGRMRLAADGKLLRARRLGMGPEHQEGL